VATLRMHAQTLLQHGAHYRAAIASLDF
jgi:hypothetical protein